MVVKQRVKKKFLSKGFFLNYRGVIYLSIFFQTFRKLYQLIKFVKYLLLILETLRLFDAALHKWSSTDFVSISQFPSFKNFNLNQNFDQSELRMNVRRLVSNLTHIIIT